MKLTQRWWLGCLVLCFVWQGCSLVAMHRQQVVGALKGAGYEAQTTSLPAGKMHYFIGGKSKGGTPLLLVHGFGADAADTWRHQMPTLGKQHRVFAPDLFWFGMSVPAPGRKISTPLAQAKALAALMDKHKCAKVDLVGVSFGGYVSLQFARTFPQRIRRLILVDAAGLSPTSSERAKMISHFAYAKGDLARLLMPADGKELNHFLKQVFFKPRSIPGFAAKEVLEELFWKNKAAKQRIARHLETHFLKPEQLKQIKATTLVVWGKHDRLLLPGMGQRLARGIPNAKLLVFEKSGHMPMLDQPKRFNNLLQGFLGQ